jgi:rfaE bifunctional protein kinase chain/domain
MSLIGNDEVAEYAIKLLKDAGVKTFFVTDEDRPTTLKQRFRSQGKSLLRVSHLRQASINKAHQDAIMNKLALIIDKLDLLVFSDFNYGCLPQVMVDKIILLAKKNNVMLAADSQSSSQVGDISRFHDMDLITPTEREARLSINNHEDGLVIIADKLRQKSNCKNILLKLGEEGLIIIGPGQKNWLTDRIGAINHSPKDVAGAGDSLLITSILSLSSGANIWETSFLGSLSAAIQVGRVGNTPIKAKELILELT